MGRVLRLGYCVAPPFPFPPCISASLLNSKNKIKPPVRAKRWDRRYFLFWFGFICERPVSQIRFWPGASKTLPALVLLLTQELLAQAVRASEAKNTQTLHLDYKRSQTRPKAMPSKAPEKLIARGKIMGLDT